MRSQKWWFGLVGLLVLMALVVAACGGATLTPDATMDQGDEEVMTQNDADEEMTESEPDDDMMDGGSDNETTDKESDEAMMDHDSDKERMDDDSNEERMDEDSDEEMMDDESGEEMTDLPDWFHAELTDVTTGETFTLADYQGEVVLVETMAIWCSNCLRQQREVKALHDSLDGEAAWATVVLDIDPNENADDLQAYTEKHGFDWIYAVAPRDVAREIGQIYGDQFLNPPSTPMLIIDRHGEAHPLPFGRKSAESLQEALAPFLDEGM